MDISKALKELVLWNNAAALINEVTLGVQTGNLQRIALALGRYQVACDLASVLAKADAPKGLTADVLLQPAGDPPPATGQPAPGGS